MSQRTRIDLSCRSGSVGIDRPLLRRQIRKACGIAGLQAGELSLSLVCDAEIRELNRTHRNLDQPTDVLAFAFQEERRLPDSNLIGDVVVSVDTAKRQAQQRETPLQQVVEDLLIHGILHLLGYDHVASPQRARVMRAKEREIRRSLDEGA